jgi:hypothetical protein
MASPRWRYPVLEMAVQNTRLNLEMLYNELQALISIQGGNRWGKNGVFSLLTDSYL